MRTSDIWLGWMEHPKGYKQKPPNETFGLLLIEPVVSHQHPRGAKRKATLLGSFSFWLGWMDSNQRMTISETVALPLGDTPLFN